MPGLLGGIARTAVVAGTATAVSNRVSRRQARRWARDDQSMYAAPASAQPQYVQTPAAPAASPQDDMVEQLTKLGQLRDQGILTEDEFATQKAKILSA